MSACWRLRVTSLLMVVIAIAGVNCTKKGPSGANLTAAVPTCPAPLLCTACPAGNWGVCYNGGIWSYENLTEALEYGNYGYGPYPGSSQCPSAAYYAGWETPPAGGECLGAYVTPAWAPQYSYGNCGAPNNTFSCVSATAPYVLTTPCSLTTASTCSCPVTGQTYCGTGTTAACTDTTSDNNNCGSCGNACPKEQYCNNGTCINGTACSGSLTSCYGSCVDTSADPSNCGGCTNLKGGANYTCATGAACSNGVCGCPTGQTPCSGVCTDTQKDKYNCGACATAGGANVCGNGNTCHGGQCKCGGSLPNPCPSNAPTGCFNFDTDNQNCGKCGNVCTAATGGTACNNGICGSQTFQTCNACGSAGVQCASGQACIPNGTNPYICDTIPGLANCVTGGTQTQCTCQ